MNLSEKQKGILALIGLAILYASLGLLARFLSLDFTILQQVYLRIFAAMAIVVIVIAGVINVLLILFSVLKMNKLQS